MEFNFQRATSQALSHRQQFLCHLAKTVYGVTSGIGADVRVHAVAGERSQQATAEPSGHIPDHTAFVWKEPITAYS